jgi:hypothetical protein
MSRVVDNQSALVAVDTGLTALGWALWMPGERRVSPPQAAGVVEGDARGRPWWERAESIARRLADDVLRVRAWSKHPPTAPVVQVVEWPEFRGGSAVGQAAAAEESLQKLAYMCGTYAGQGRLHGWRTVPVAVSEWKGQLPKGAVERRVRRAVGGQSRDGTRFSSHAWDAVGIGLVARGWDINNAEA